MFTGLGCDVAALNSYLKAHSIDTSRLFTIDLICYGPALPEIHRQYIENLEAKYRSRIKSFSVRHKYKGWTPKYIRAEFEDSREFLAPFDDTDYGQAFGQFTREGCYACRFKGAGHQADITVGDYWGLTPEMPGWNDNGVSVLLVRTEKGEALLERIDPQEFTVRTADAEFVIEHNPMYYKSREKPQDYKKFCDDLSSAGLHRAIVNHNGGVLKYTAIRAKKTLKKIVPSSMKQFIKRILRACRY